LFNIIGKRYWFFLLSAIVIVPGLISLVTFGLNPGPDFVGGTELEVQIPTSGQTTQLGSLLESSTKTPAQPAGHIVSIMPGGTQLIIQAPISTATTKLTSLVKTATGSAPLSVTPPTKTTCAPTCDYTVELSATLGTGGAIETKLKSALAKAYPPKGKTPGAVITSSANGSEVKLRVPVNGVGPYLQSMFVNDVGVIPTTTIALVSATGCPMDCVYRILTPTALKPAERSALATQFAKDFHKTAAQPGVAPQSVNTVTGSNCPRDCYDIRSKYLTPAQIVSFTAALVKAYPSHTTVGKLETQVVSYESVGGTVAASTKQNAIIAVSVAAIFILSYITFAFRKMPHPVRYGTAAIIAMLHDVLVVVGIFSILGKVLNMEIDATFVTALLTIIGFSVHDTIVIFDRIRENVTRRTGEQFEAVVNHSVLQSFVRSINTSFTVVLTLGAIFLFTGEQIRTFVLAMLIGIISGTYSSIFNASPILVVWETGELKRIFGRGRKPDTNTVASTNRLKPV